MIHLLAPLDLPEPPLSAGAPTQPEFKIAPRRYALYAEPKNSPRMYCSGNAFTADVLAADFYKSKRAAYRARRSFKLFTCGIISSRGKIEVKSSCRKLPTPFLKQREELKDCSDFVCIKNLDGKPGWLNIHGAWSTKPIEAEHFFTYQAARRAANMIGDHNANVRAIPDSMFVPWLCYSLLETLRIELTEQKILKITSKKRSSRGPHLPAG